MAHGGLVGRERERELVDEALRGALGGTGRLVIVHGEAGIGKTRLLEAVAESAMDAGFTVLEGGAVPNGAALPYGPVIEAMGALLTQYAADELERLVGSAGWAQLARLDPLRDIPPEPMDVGLAQARLYAAMTALLHRLAVARPVALLLDDLQWSDASTLALVGWLARPAARAPLVLVLSWRDPIDGDAPLQRVQPELMRMRGSIDLALGPLNERSLRDLVEERRPGLELTQLERLVDACSGNPFYAVTLAEEWRGEDVPPRLTHLLRRSWSEVSSDARQLLCVLAVLGRAADLPLIEAVCGLPPSAVDAGLFELTEARLVEATGALVRVRHALVADAVAGKLAAGQRRAVHAAIAAGLGAHAVPSAGALHAERAHHLAAAGDVVRAAEASLAAAREARHRLAFTEAALHYASAVDAADVGQADGRARLRLLLEAADVVRWQTNRGRGEAWLREAADLAAALSDPLAAAEVECVRGRLLWARGDAPGSLAAYERAERALPADADAHVRGRVLAWLATGLMTMSRHREARVRAREALGLVAPGLAQASVAVSEGTSAWPTDPAAANIALQALITGSTAAAWVGDTDAALDGLRTAMDAARAQDNVDALSRAYGNLTFALAVAGDWEATGTSAAEGLQWTRQLGLGVSGAAVLVNNRISALVALGRWEEAREESAALLAEEPPHGMALTLHLTLAELAAISGVGSVEAHLEEASDLPGKDSDPQLVLYGACARAEEALWRQRPERAREIVACALAAPGMRDFSFGRLRLLGLALRAEADIAFLARAPGAGPMLDDALERADRFVAELEEDLSTTPSGRAMLSTAKAEAARAHAVAVPPSAALASMWADSAAAWAAAGECYPQAYSLFRQASALLSTQQPVAAMKVLVDSLCTARRLDARPLHTACVLLARSAGLEGEVTRAVTQRESAPQKPVEAPRPAPSGLPRLTLRERQVLDLLAQGCTTRTAARRLGISEKTVSVHLTHVYEKLGVTNRTEAVMLALRAGLVASP